MKEKETYKAYIFVRKDLSSIYGVKVIINQIERILPGSKTESELREIPSNKLVIPYGVLESKRLIGHKNERLKIAFLVDAYSLGDISDFKFFLGKSYIPFSFNVQNLLKFFKHIYYEYLIFRHYDRVMLVSHYDKEYYSNMPFIKKYSNKSVVIPNGVLLPQKKAYVQRAERAFTVGCLSLWSGDEVFYTLKCFLNEVWKKVPADSNIRLVIAGRGISTEMTDYVAQFNNVTIIGEVEHLEDFYKNIDASLITMAKKCGIINRVLDGFSNQVPVISRPESLLAFKGLPNCYYTYTDINTFLSSANQIRNNPEETANRVSDAYDYVKEHHNWEKNYEILNNLL